VTDDIFSQLRDRLQLAPAWKISDWGLSFWPIHYLFNLFREYKFGPLPLVYKGSDEWSNLSIAIIIPLIGRIVYFYEKNINCNTWFLSSSSGRIAHYISPDYKHEAHIEYDGDFDSLLAIEPILTNEQIRIRSHYIERLED